MAMGKEVRRFWCGDSAVGEMKSGKRLISLVGPAEVPPFNKINHLILSRRHNGPQMDQRFLTERLANPGDFFIGNGPSRRTSGLPRKPYRLWALKQQSK